MALLKNPLKKIIFFLWLILILGGLSYFITHQEQFEAKKIAALMQRFNNYMLLAYLVISILRGFTLIPSTPFVLAGGIAFPGQELLVLCISLLGILGSAALIYHFSDQLNFKAALEKLYPHHKLKQKLESRYGLFFVFLWSFIPVVPTDAVCYAAGAVRMNFIAFLLAVLLGELIICSLYVFTGAGLVNLIT